MASDTQILKGLLEGCILKIVKENETYGYEICERLVNYGFKDITEGSVYPILIRLEKKKLIYSVMKNSPFGPKRKYYYLTDEGVAELQNFVISWNGIKTNVDSVLGGEL
ncbi:PadR family transcriptional regulator [Clostridium sp. FP1]|uniref:PadR family transcriptional regulator n=1 Tax=Clostridium sp. FP1 TaxID=2724076 RepID=UPI0013E98502|nr:PadR family transcriptional regulator [Clostridium sp. FP1]MBZ9634093.1 PadR family transcriptional regulator [Clostridium sp. FP1]